MKKIYLKLTVLLLTLIVGIGQMWADKTVYFVNISDWSQVNAHCFNTGDSDKETNWPGYTCTKIHLKVDGHDVYSYTTSKNKVIFSNNGSSQTETHDVKDGFYFYNGVWCRYYDGNEILYWTKSPSWASWWNDNNLGKYIYIFNNGAGTNTGVLTGSEVTIDGTSYYYYKIPKGCWQNFIMLRSTNIGSPVNKTGDMGFAESDNYVNNWSENGTIASFSYLVPQISTATVTPATSYSGAGTSLSPYLVSPSASVTVNASTTCPVSDGNMTVKYTFTDASGGSLQSESTSDSYSFDASAVVDETYSVKVTAKNYFKSYSGTAATSSVIYFKVSATPAVALAVSTAGPIASGTELTLTATPSNTTETPTYSYYYSTDAGDNYTAIASTDETPVTSTTQTFTPAVNTPGTYQFKVIMHHSSSDYECTVYPTTDVQQRRTMAVKNKFTDLYGYNTTVDASTPSVTGIYNTLSATRDAAPDGYVFAGWEKTSSLSFVSGDATSSSTSVTMSASADDQTLTALYTAKKRIYFDNSSSRWDGDIYVYMLKEASWWDNMDKDGQGPGLVLKNKNGYERYYEYAKMTHIEGTDVYYYEYTNHTGYVAFTKGDYHSSAGVFGTSAAYRADFNECAPLYIASGTWTTTNSTGFHNAGYWKRHNTTHSGFSLWIDEGGSRWVEHEFTNNDPSSSVYTTSVVLSSANTVYGYNVARCFGGKKLRRANYGGDIQDSDSDYPRELGESDSDGGMRTSSAGTYNFTLSLINDHIYMTVEYPVSKGDYRVVLNNGTKNHSTGRVLRARTEEKTDTISVFIDHTKAASNTLYIDTCSYTGNPLGWTIVAGVSMSLNKAPYNTTTGVYNFAVTRTRQTDVTIVELEEKEYDGDYYIRTDAADGHWTAYMSTEDNKMHYSEYSLSTSAAYDYYYTKWAAKDKNMHFVIANDYSPCISDTLKSDATYLNASDALPENANVRFMWNSGTNATSRAFISGSSDITHRFLVLEGDDKMFDKDGNALTGVNQYHRENEDGTTTYLGTDNQVVFDDDHNWIYETTVKAQPGAKVKLTAKYNESVQYFYGDEGTDTEDSVLLIGGTGSNRYKMRIVYDFKTNRLIKAFIPEGTIESNLAIEADLMIIREHQEEAQQVSFSGSGALSKVETVYGAMKFNKWTVNNKSKTGEHDELTGDDELSQYKRDLFWISFPFDVELSDVFGFGEYGTHWIIEYYDGKGRATNGFWADSEPNWKFVMPSQRSSFTMKAFEGYILALDLEEMTESSSIWDNDVEDVYVYFPSSVAVKDIQATNRLVTISQDGYYCSIKRDTPDGDRRVKDSYWHCIGVPSFANYSSSLTMTNGGATIDWRSTSMPYLYEWNPDDNSLEITSSATFSFKATHSYLVQYAGSTIYWSAVNVTPASVASRVAETEDREYKLVLQSDERTEDQTFIRLTDDANVTTEFEFNYDLSKEMNKNRGNIYTLISSTIDSIPTITEAAANVQPKPLQTTLVPVGVKVVTGGEYTLAMPEGTNGEDVFLIDNAYGTRTNLGLMPYTVTLTAGTYDSRFALEFGPVQDAPTGLENDGLSRSDELNDANDDVRKVFVGGRLYIIRDGKVYDAAGQRIE